MRSSSSIPNGLTVRGHRLQARAVGDAPPVGVAGAGAEALPECTCLKYLVALRNPQVSGFIRRGDSLAGCLVSSLAVPIAMPTPRGPQYIAAESLLGWTLGTEGERHEQGACTAGAKGDPG